MGQNIPLFFAKEVGYNSTKLGHSDQGMDGFKSERRNEIGVY